MTTNVIIVVFAYVAIGGMAQLMTLRYPTPGEQWASVVKISIGGLLAGAITSYLPIYVNVWFAVAFFSIPFLGDVVGLVVGQWIDTYRVWIDGKRVDDERGKDKGQDGARPEQRGRNGHSGGNGEDVGRKVEVVPSDTRTGPGEDNAPTSGGSNGVG